MTRIARDLKVTLSQVSQVLYGKWPSHDGEVERALKAAGAPNVKLRKEKGK